MTLLAIDTATRTLSLALHDGNTLIAEQSYVAGNQHNILLAPATQHMMQVCGVETGDLTALAVSIGPGSYTGLRIGIAFAKGMATSRTLPLVSLTSLETLAIAHPHHTHNHLVAAVQAGRGRIIAQQFQWQDDRWQATNEPDIMEWDALFESLEGTFTLTGEVNEKGREALAKAQENGSSVTLSPAVNRLRRAGFLAEEAWHRLKQSQDRAAFAAATIAPIYLKSND